MKIQIPTKYDTVPAEIFDPIHISPNLRVEKRAGGYYELYLAEKVGMHEYLGEKVGMYNFYEGNRTETISRYCYNCGCEACATWPRPAFSFTPLGTWKFEPNRAERVALQPFFERQKLQDDFMKKVEAEKAEIRKRPCPVCGQEMYLWRENKNTEILEAYDKLKSYSESCDVPVSVTVDPEVVTSIKSDTEKLKDYLLRVIKVEKNIMFVFDRLFFLRISTYDVNREAKFAQLYPIMSKREDVAKTVSGLKDAIERKRHEIEDLKRQRETLAAQSITVPTATMPREPSAPPKPILATPNLFNRKRVSAENAEKTDAYNRALTKYESDLAQYRFQLEETKQKTEAIYQETLAAHKKKLQVLDNEIAKNISIYQTFRHKTEAKIQRIEVECQEDLAILKDETSYPAVQLKITLDKEIADAESLLKELYIQKHQLYGADIIFKKYRDLVSVSSFYEYLLSGRCESLDGVNGCYNLYETELRSNRIINELTQIRSSIETIKDNQYMLYSQLNDINTELSALNATTMSMIETAHSAAAAYLEHSSALMETVHSTAEAFLSHSSVIAHNSAVAAYYSKINAEIASSTRYINLYFM